MVVHKLITKTEKNNLDIIGATLLTVEEACNMPKKLREHLYNWWLQTPGYDGSRASYVSCYGEVNEKGGTVSYNDFAVIRPALILINLEHSDFAIGDSFLFGNEEFVIISNTRAFCKGDIGMSYFRKNYEAHDANEYIASDIKKFLDNWFFEESTLGDPIFGTVKKKESPKKVTVKIFDKNTDKVLKEFTMPLNPDSVVKKIEEMRAENAKRKELIDKLNEEMEKILEKIKVEQEAKKYNSAEEQYEDEYDHYLKMALDDIEDYINNKKEKCDIDTYKIAEDTIILQISQEAVDGNKCPICKNNVEECVTAAAVVKELLRKR